jgi:hypothetical protein
MIRQYLFSSSFLDIYVVLTDAFTRLNVNCVISLTACGIIYEDIAMCGVVRVTKITGSSLDDRIY